MENLLELCAYYDKEWREQEKKWFYYLRPSTDRLMKDWTKTVEILKNKIKYNMKQLSDCCKAEIILTGKERPEAFACIKCDRIIGTPINNMTKIWKDVCVREDYRGYHYLLQICELENGKKIFKNRPIDKGIIDTILFHGFQGIVDLLTSQRA